MIAVLLLLHRSSVLQHVSVCDGELETILVVAVLLVCKMQNLLHSYGCTVIHGRHVISYHGPVWQHPPRITAPLSLGPFNILLFVLSSFYISIHL